MAVAFTLSVDCYSGIVRSFICVEGKYSLLISLGQELFRILMWYRLLFGNRFTKTFPFALYQQTCLPVPIFAGHTDFGPQSRFPDFMRGCTDFGRCGNF